jgi:hypothetical protein
MGRTSATIRSQVDVERSESGDVTSELIADLDRERRGDRMSNTTKWLAGTNAVLGLWLIAAPFVLGVSGAGLWKAVVVGSLIALASGYNWYLTTKDGKVSRLVAYSAAVLGLWVIAAPFVFGVGTAVMWNDLIVGAVVASFGGYNGYTGGGQDRPQVHSLDHSRPVDPSKRFLMAPTAG